jgi:hypothetical protein
MQTLLTLFALLALLAWTTQQNTTHGGEKNRKKAQK